MARKEVPPWADEYAAALCNAAGSSAFAAGQIASKSTKTSRERIVYMLRIGSLISSTTGGSFALPNEAAFF